MSKPNPEKTGAKPTQELPKGIQDSELYGLPGHLVRRCHQIATGLFHEELAEYGLTPAQFAVLRRLYELGSVDQITLSGYAAINHVTMGEVTRRLEGRGLLARRVNPEDRRARLLSLTDLGRELTERAMPAVYRVQERLLSPLRAAERKTLTALLQRIADENNELSRAPLKLRPRRPDRNSPED